MWKRTGRRENDQGKRGNSVTGRYHCETCRRVYKTRFALEDHYKDTHQSASRVVYECTICFHIAALRRAVRAHIKKHHGADVKAHDRSPADYIVSRHVLGHANLPAPCWCGYWTLDRSFQHHQNHTFHGVGQGIGRGHTRHITTRTIDGCKYPSITDGNEPVVGRPISPRPGCKTFEETLDELLNVPWKKKEDPVVIDDDDWEYVEVPDENPPPGPSVAGPDNNDDDDDVIIIDEEIERTELPETQPHVSEDLAGNVKEYIRQEVNYQTTTALASVATYLTTGQWPTGNMQ